MRKSGWKEWGKNSDNSLQTKQIGRDFSLSLSLKAPLTEDVLLSTIDKCNSDQMQIEFCYLRSYSSKLSVILLEVNSLLIERVTTTLYSATI